MHGARGHFALALDAIWTGTAATLVMRRATSTDTAGRSDLFLGADSEGNRHILARIEEDYAFKEIKGEVLSLKEWRHPESGERYLDLQCASDQLVRPFSTVADHIIESVQADGALPHLAVLDALREFERLLRPARALTEEHARGLFGELVILKMLAAKNPLFAVESWLGPFGELHDFRTQSVDLEVKTSSTEGRNVIISSLNQLDRVANVPLILIRVRVESSPKGQNLADLTSELTDLGCFRSSLVERLDQAGFRIGVDGDEHRFTVTEPPMAWLIDDAFPGLRSTDIPEERRGAISGIKYTLDLVEAPGELNPEQFDQFLEKMVTN